MAVVAERLVIEITTNADKASRQLGKLNQQTGKADKSAQGLKGAWSSIQALGIAAIAAKAAQSIIQLGRATIEAASASEETANRFNTVFADIGSDAQAAAQNLEDNFGLSSRAAQDLLASTGDLLTGFGFTQEAALDLSDQANQLAIDLASFTNVPIEQSSRAITSALTGEVEALKSLGIVVRQGTAEFRDQVSAIQEATGVTESQARAQVILQQAYEQSGNAIGDFERSQDSYANTQRTTQAAIENLAATIGQSIIPAATEASRIIGDLARRLDDLLSFDNQVAASEDAVVALQQGIEELNDSFDEGAIPDEAFAAYREEVVAAIAVQQDLVDTLEAELEVEGRLNFRRRGVLETAQQRLRQAELTKVVIDEQLVAYDELATEGERAAQAAIEREQAEQRAAALLADQLSLQDRIAATLNEYASEDEQALFALDEDINALVELRTEARELGVTYGDLQQQINALVEERAALIESFGQEQEIIETNSDQEDEWTERYLENLQRRSQAEAERNEARVEAERQAAAEIQAINEQLEAARSQIVENTFDLLAALIDRNVEDEKTAAAAKKTLAIFEATIATAAAVAEALPNIPLAIAVGAAGAIQVATIAAQPLPTAQFGGDFVVPPGNNGDSGLLRVNSGEQVSVTPSRGGGASQPLVVKLVLGDREFTGAVEDVFNKKGGQIRNANAVRLK